MQKENCLVVPSRYQQRSGDVSRSSSRKTDELLLATGTEGKSPATQTSIPVLHQCFGSCRGRFFPHLYTTPTATCIECEECGTLLTPAHFVAHSHSNFEHRTCHWGFDSDNWRFYMHLPTVVADDPTWKQCLNEVKERFNKVSPVSTGVEDGFKRKLVQEECRNSLENGKRPRVCAPQAKQEFVNDSKNAALPYFLYYDPLVLSYLRAYAASLASGQGAAVRPCFPLDTTVNKRDGTDVAQQFGLNHFQNQFFCPFVKDDLPKTALNQTSSPMDNKALLGNVPKFDAQSMPVFADGEQFVEHISEQALNKLLTTYVSDPMGVSVIRSRFLEYAKLMEQRLGSMVAQNRLLQQEIACLRNKQTVAIPNCLPLRSCVTKSCS